MDMSPNLKTPPENLAEAASVLSEGRRLCPTLSPRTRNPSEKEIRRVRVILRIIGEEICRGSIIHFLSDVLEVGHAPITLKDTELEIYYNSK